MVTALRPYAFLLAAGISLFGGVVACSTSNGDETGEDDVKGRRSKPADEEEDYGPSGDPTPVPETVPPMSGPDAGGGDSAVPGAPVCAAIPTCANATALPDVQADGFGGATQAKAAGSKWFTVQLKEQSPALDGLGVTARLGLPPGVEADLFLYEANCTKLVKSATGPGASKEVVYDWIGIPGLNASRQFVVEVRYKSGDCKASKPWTLDVLGGSG